jgi:predicted extracellular nuclease
MRQIIRILTLALMLPALIFAGDLFFSEYIEGSSNNKAIEIYNGSGAAVNLSNFRLIRSNNGATEVQDSLLLTGTLSDKDVYVIGNPSAISAILNVSDTTHTITYFNGDDFLGLQKKSSDVWTTIDVLGQLGEDPGTAWSVAGVSNAMAEHTLVRKITVIQGNTNWSESAGTNTNDSEWLVYLQDNCTYLGSHVAGSENNIFPIANAGNDQVVAISSNVTLDGSGSADPDGNIIAYSWLQIGGVSVTISTPTQSTCQFTAPSNETVLTFELTVTDDSSATDKDTINVSVVDDSPSNIFISEYVEGTSYNKYIELYNASDESINLITSQYELKICINGANNFTGSFNDWGTVAEIPSGGVIVLANSQATKYSSPDIITPYSTSSPLNFNGNDAVALFRKGLLVDVIGDPTKIDTILDNRTMRRNSTVIVGNPTYTVGEWTEYEVDNVDNLGSHSTNPNAPVVSDITYTPEFVTSADEITVSATLTPVVGTIASAKIYYGVSGSLINSTDMWNETGDTWMGVIPTQTGNSIIEFYITCSDNQSPANSGQSSSRSVVIANSSPETIANIQANASTLNGQMVTIRGIVTIGAGVLASGYTSAYIQDESGRGLNLYDGGTLYSDIARGDELLVVGYVDQYYTTVELTDFTYKVLSTGNDLPVAQSVTIAGANSSDWEGTLIEFSGPVVKKTAYTTAVNIFVAEGTDTTIARIAYTTGIDTSTIVIGSRYKFKGVGYQYSSDYETLIGYSTDIMIIDAINGDAPVQPLVFSLSPAYPNPFNPQTRINWQLSRNGKYELAVYNMLGQKIDVIGSGYANAGSYSKVWNASQFPSGVYFVQLKAENKVQTQKLLYLK